MVIQLVLVQRQHKAGVEMLLSKEAVNTVSLMTPKGILLNLEILHINIEENQVSCAVKKMAGMTLI